MSKEIMKKLKEHDEQLDAIARNVVEHSVRLNRIEESVATKENISKVMNVLDTIVGLAKKKEQELTFMGERVSRVEKDVQMIKTRVSLA